MDVSIGLPDTVPGSTEIAAAVTERIGLGGREDDFEFVGAGCDELILCPSSSDPAQVDLLADAAGL